MSRSTTQVIILAAGFATRLRPLSERIPKPLIDIAKKTILHRIITCFKNAGFTKFCILHGYLGEMIKQEVGKIEDIEVEYVEQQEICGMADAILTCLDYIDSKPNTIQNYFVSAADVIFEGQNLLDMFNLFESKGADMILSLMRSNDLEIAKGHGNVAFKSIEDSSDARNPKQGLRITDIIEKPKKEEILSEYYSLPLYLFNRKITSYLRDVELSKRGEKEFQDAIKMAIGREDLIFGLNIIPELISIKNVGKYHLTYLRDILTMNERFLNDSILLFENVKNGTDTIISKSFIHENCRIGDHSRVENSILYESSQLGKYCYIDNCLIDSKVILPDNYRGSNLFVTKDEKGNIEEIPL